MQPHPILKSAKDAYLSSVKVALVHTRLLQRGGLESRMFSYLRYFHDRGDEVTVIVSKVGQDVALPEGVRVIRIPMKLIPKWLRALRFNAQLGRILQRENFDFVLSMGRTTHHDAMIVGGVHKAYIKARNRSFLLPTDYLQIHMDQRAYHAPGVLLAASEMIRQQMIDEHGADPGKVHVLYPPTDPDKFPPDIRERRIEFRRHFGFSDERSAVVLLSSNNRLKGVPLLLEVFARMEAAVDLYVAGPEPISSVLPNVHYLGYITEPEQLLAAADLMVLPSEYDAFAQVVTESLFCGTPVVVSQMVGAQTVVTKREGLIVPSFDPEEWKSAILSALQTDFAIDREAIAARGLRFEDHMTRLLSLSGKV